MDNAIANEFRSPAEARRAERRGLVLYYAREGKRREAIRSILAQRHGVTISRDTLRRDLRALKVAARGTAR